eukprot:14776624-Heterocapsa_arctica.AAC.1
MASAMTSHSRAARTGKVVPLHLTFALLHGELQMLFSFSFFTGHDLRVSLEVAQIPEHAPY